MYRALRSLKVQKADGTMSKRQPGDPVPEAATFRNLKSWINRGWITDEDGSTPPEHRAVAEKVLEPAPEPKAEPTPEPVAKEAEPEDLASELASLSKRDLNALAKEQDLNPKDYESREDLEVALKELDG